MKHLNIKSVYVIAIISKVSNVLLTLLGTIIINRMLGVASRGEYAYIINIVSITNIVFSFGLAHVYSTYYRKSGLSVRDTFTTMSILHALISCLLSIVIFVAFQSYKGGFIFMLTAGMLLKNNFLHIAAVEDVKERDINTIVFKLIYTIVLMSVFFVWIRSLNAALLLLLFDEAIVTLGIAVKYNFKFKLAKVFEFGLRRIYKLGFISMLLSLMVMLNYSVDIIILEIMTANNTYVGLYSVGVTLANLVWILPEAFLGILVNKTARYDAVDEIIKLIQIMFVTTLVIVVSFYWIGLPVIKLMYGVEYSGSYNVTLILFIGCLPMILHKLITPLYISNGKQMKIAKIFAIAVLFNILLNILLIPQYNIIGAALASVVSYTLAGMVILVDFCKKYNISVKKLLTFNLRHSGDENKSN